MSKISERKICQMLKKEVDENNTNQYEAIAGKLGLSETSEKTYSRKRLSSYLIPLLCSLCLFLITACLLPHSFEQTMGSIKDLLRTDFIRNILGLTCIGSFLSCCVFGYKVWRFGKRKRK